MRQNDRRRRLFKTFTACLLAVAMLLSNVMGVVEVYAAAVKAPTVNPVLYDATTISGGDLAKAKVGGKNVIATVHVILKGQDGTVKATLEDTPKSGTKWSVSLPEGVKVAKGDTVTVYQQIGDDKSPEVTANAEPSKADSVTLTMPSGEIWIEQYVANIVNADEKAEAIDLLKKANPTIAKDIKSVEFKITGEEPNKVASYTVTYTDNSKTGEIQAPDLTVKKVTETSRTPEIGSITIVDNVVKGKLAGPGSFDGIKVQLVIRVNKEKLGQYCNANGCKVDKDSSDPIDVTLQDDGSFSYTLKAGESLELDQIVGVSVKEPHKFKSCSTTTVKPVTPVKTDVKDPEKLTDADKDKIVEAIKTAYTVDGESKLPNGTGYYKDIPAYIEFDKDGNVKIINPSNVNGKWESGKFVPNKKADGSLDVKDESQVITIPAKDLLKNIKPDAPTVALSDDKKNITITPNLELDTDAKTIAVSYKDKDDKDQKITVTKADDGTWSITEGNDSGATVNENGVVTLPKNKVKGKTDVTATVTDKGGVADDDKTPLASDPGSLTVKETKADKVEALGGLDPVELKKWVGDTVDWKDGVKAKDDAKKDEVAELLKGASFEDVTEEKRGTTKEGDFKGKIKITFDDKSELVVENQMLYVSNSVTSMNRKDKVPTDALDVEFKLGEGTKVDNTDGTAIEGNKDKPVSYQKYMVKPQTNLKEYKNETLKETYYNLINSKVKAQDKYTEPVWNNGEGSVTEDFVITKANKVFTAKATKTYDITFDANTGGGTKDKVTQKVNTEYELPAKDTFTPPNENQQFSGWQVGEDTSLKQPGEKITITGDTVVKAIWKSIEVKVKFQTETGATGEMKEQTVNKGNKYTLPDPTFTPDPGKEFAGWKVGNGTELKKAGEEIDISGDVTLTATWKDSMVDVTFVGNGGGGSMDKETLKKGSTYKLPANGFTAPENKEFDGWTVNGKDKKVGDEIKVDANTTVTAKWKAKAPEAEEIIVKFKANGGTGSMKDLTVKKGAKFKLPANGFTAPEGKEFDGWDVNGKTVPAGTETSVTGNMEFKAVWKAKTKTPDPKPERPDDSGRGSGFWFVTAPAEPEKEIGRHDRYLYGYEDKRVRPEGNITRAEAAALIARLAELDMSDKSKPDFVDTPSAWYNSAINIMVKKDLMFGDKNGHFRPAEPITRGEFARALLYIDATNDKVAPFADVKGHPFEAAINQAYGNNRISGYPDGTFRPDAYIQRAEAARILNQYANRGTTLEGMAPVAKDLIQFTDINPSHWAYCEVMEAANTHEYERVKGTQAETWLRILHDEMKR